MANRFLIRKEVYMKPFDLFNIPDHQPEVVKIRNGEYLFVPDFFDKAKSDHYFNHLFKNSEWKQEEMRMYGKTIKFPRLTAWYGDKPYTYSGITHAARKWTDVLLEIRGEIERKAQVSFNSVLLNLYRSGNDSISWHADAEKALGENPIIASVSFGVTRKFQLRHNETKEKIQLELGHGSLLIMKGELQHYWQHQVPKTKREVEQRINLTFRTIKEVGEAL